MRLPEGYALLRERDYRLLWLAHPGSVTGDGLYAVALTRLAFSTVGAGAQGLAVLGNRPARAGARPGHPLGHARRPLGPPPSDGPGRPRTRRGDARARGHGVLGAADPIAIVAAGVALTTATLFFNPARHAMLPAYVAPVTGALATSVGPVALIAASGSGLMVIGALALVASLRQLAEPAAAPV